jgi:3-oxoacyl-[acyl-carrier protein] reductase
MPGERAPAGDSSRLWYPRAVGLLDGRAAVITGAAQGIGLAIARRFVAEGASVVIGDLTAALSGPMEDLGGRATYRPCDVTDEGQVAALVQTCVDEYGALDVMVNNAGFTRDATMRKMSLEDFRAVVDVHLQGAWLGTKHAGLVMREQQRGAIVNLSSISGKVGNIGQTNYSAAKAGIVGLTKAAAKELAHTGVRVNAIQPGLIRTAMTQGMRQDILEQRIGEIPLGRIGEPDDVGRAIAMLLSDDSRWITAQAVEVSGGFNL